MTKLDDLIAQLESPQPFERALVLAELRRLQARERRLEELANELSMRIGDGHDEVGCAHCEALNYAAREVRKIAQSWRKHDR